MRSQAGVALLIALFSMMVMVVIAVEVSTDSAVDYASTSQAVNRLKAYYAARGAMELSLMRIKLFRQLAGQGKSSSPSSQAPPGQSPPASSPGSSSGGSGIPLQLLDQIWQLPFMWPFPIPPTVSIPERQQIEEVTKQSKMDCQYVTRIESEGGKLDINDLGSDSEFLRNSTRAQLMMIFNNKILTDEKFAERYRSYNFDELINNISGWVTNPNTSGVAAGKPVDYSELSKDNRFLPPRQPLKTLDELHIIALMNDEIYDLLAPKLTVYGSKGISINYSTDDMIRSLDPKITDQVIAELNKYRLEVGPFLKKEDFIQFLKNQGVNTKNLEDEKALPLYFDAESNFRITVTATFGKATREIVAITYDFDKVSARFAEMLAQNDKSTSGTGGTNPDPNSSKKTASGTTNTPPAPSTPPTTSTPAKGRPRVVYWSED